MMAVMKDDENVAAALSAVVTVTLAWRPAHGTVRLAVEPKYDARVRPAPHHHHCTVTANAAFAVPFILLIRAVN